MSRYIHLFKPQYMSTLGIVNILILAIKELLWEDWRTIIVHAYITFIWFSPHIYSKFSTPYFNLNIKVLTLIWGFKAPLSISVFSLAMSIRSLKTSHHEEVKFFALISTETKSWIVKKMVSMYMLHVFYSTREYWGIRPF